MLLEFAASDPHLNTAVDRALIGGTDIDLPVNAVAPCDDTVKKNILSPLNRRCQHRITTSSSLTELHYQPTDLLCNSSETGSETGYFKCRRFQSCRGRSRRHPTYAPCRCRCFCAHEEVNPPANRKPTEVSRRSPQRPAETTKTQEWHENRTGDDAPVCFLTPTPLLEVTGSNENPHAADKT